MKIKNEIFQQPLSNLAILIRFRNTVKGKGKGSSKWSHFKNLAPTKTIKSYPTTSIRRFSFFRLLHISERQKLENKHDKWTWVFYTQLFQEFHFPWQTPQKNNSYFFLPIRHEIIHIFSIEDEHRFFFFFPFLNAEFQPKHHIVAEEYYIKYWKLDSQKKKKNAIKKMKNEKNWKGGYWKWLGIEKCYLEEKRREGETLWRRLDLTHTKRIASSINTYWGLIFSNDRDDRFHFYTSPFTNYRI